MSTCCFYVGKFSLIISLVNKRKIRFFHLVYYSILLKLGILTFMHQHITKVTNAILLEITWRIFIENYLHFPVNYSVQLYSDT